jgi:3-deoxy-D-manno-octulosonic-acid transferase
MAQLAWVRSITSGRRIFLAASTHPGEEALLADVHRALAGADPSHLTIIVPRHPERGAEIAGMLRSQGIPVARRAINEPITPATAVYIADTLGELGIFYKLAPFALIGGSLMPVGGHNPIEAVKLGCGVTTGPHWHNFPEVYQALAEAGGCRFVTSPEDLIQTIRALYDDPASLSIMKANADNIIRDLSGAMTRTLEALEPLLPPREASQEPPGRNVYAS